MYWKGPQVSSTGQYNIIVTSWRSSDTSPMIHHPPSSLFHSRLRNLTNNNVSFLFTHPPLTFGREGPLGTGFIRPHPHRPFALETGSSLDPFLPPSTLPWSLFLWEHDEDGRKSTLLWEGVWLVLDLDSGNVGAGRASANWNLQPTWTVVNTSEREPFINPLSSPGGKAPLIVCTGSSEDCTTTIVR